MIQQERIKSHGPLVASEIDMCDMCTSLNSHICEGNIINTLTCSKCYFLKTLDLNIRIVSRWHPRTISHVVKSFNNVEL